MATAYCNAHAKARRTPSLVHDSAIHRMRTRARCAAAVALVALMLGGLFGGTIEALMRPLVTAVAQLEVATHANQH